MKKILIILIIAISFYLAINFVLSILLPEKINKAAKDFVEDNFGRKITISHIDVNILRGIYLKNATVFETDRKTPYLKVKTIRVSPFYPSFLSSKKILLSINLEGVYFTLKRNPDNTFNLPQIKAAEAANTGEAKELKNSAKDIFLVKSFSIKKLNLDFVDTTAAFNKSLKDITVFADLQNYPKITSKLSWQDKLTVNAKYNSSSKELRASVMLKEIQLNEFNNYFPKLALKNGYLKDARVNIEGIENYSIKADANLNNIELAKEKAEIKGDIHTVMQFNTGKEGLVYRISGNLTNGELKLPPYLENLTAMEAAFTFDGKKLQLSNLTAGLLTEGTDKEKETQIKIAIDAAAEVNFETSQVAIKAKANPQLSDFIKTLKNLNINNLKALKNFNYEDGGSLSLDADIKTSLKNESFEYYIDYNLKNAGYKELKNIRAKGFIANNKFLAEEYSFRHKGILWQGKLELNGFNSPDIRLTANNELLNAVLTAKQLDGLLAIKDLTIKTKNSHLKSEGGYHKEKKELELQGLAYIELSEIIPLLDAYGIKIQWLKKADPSGALNTKFLIKGPLNPNEWQVKLAGLGEKLKIYGIDAKEAKLELYRDKDLLIMSPLVADVAQGKIDLRAKIDSVNKKLVINTLITDLDLEVLRKELKLKNSSLSGILSMDLNFENASLSSFDKMDGSGKVSIHKGNIWEINFLKGMGEFLFIPEFEEIAFEEGYSDLTLKGENIVFENIELKAPEMTLKGKGRLSLKGDLNFLLISEFNPNLVSASQGLKKFFTNILGQTSLAIELKGTVKKPSYDVKPVIFSDLEGFKKVFEDIFKTKSN
ncbi:MAG: AsmA-like C-terminal region-containing protein [Candidatus Omnitrophica bacterium]|nr:AsmA-like C-terminal region-containing protein [Candidatus Omnitrophota bacterium]